MTTAPAPTDIVIGPLRPSDAPRCAELERLLFAEDDPWSERAFLDELAAGHHFLAARSTARGSGGAEPAGGARVDTALGDTATVGTALVDTATVGTALVGYGGIAFVAGPPRAEAEVHTIGVDPAFQRRGIGRTLLRGLLTVVDEAAATVFLEVRTDNTAARALYEAEGFAVVGLRRRYYRPSGADAHTMRRDVR